MDRPSTHASRASQSFHNAWYNKKFSDITVIGTVKQFECHRIVLASNIHFFEEIFENKLEEYTKVLVVTRVPDDVLATILEFVYLGSVHMERNQVSTLSKWAEDLGVYGFAEYIEANYTINSNVLLAAEALDNLRHNVECHSTPRYMTTPSTSLIQPSPGSKPPQHSLQYDFHSLQYKAAASRNLSRSTCSPPRRYKRSREASPINMGENSVSPAMPEHTAGHSRPMVIVSI